MREGGRVGARERMRWCVREDTGVRERGYVGVVTGMRKLWGNRTWKWGRVAGCELFVTFVADTPM